MIGDRVIRAASQRPLLITYHYATYHLLVSRWTSHGAWVTVLEYEDLEGGKTDNSIQKLTICYQYRSG